MHAYSRWLLAMQRPTSRIRNEVKRALLIVMLDVVLLIKRVEMRGYRLRDDRLNFLRLHLGLRHELEALIRVLVGRLAFELCWFVLPQADDILLRAAHLTNRRQHSIVLLEFFLLFLSEALRISRLTLKRQRVEWILRVLLVEDVLLAILPVRE